jgi:hypothetical protein
VSQSKGELRRAARRSIASRSLPAAAAREQVSDDFRLADVAAGVRRLAWLARIMATISHFVQATSMV